MSTRQWRIEIDPELHQAWSLSNLAAELGDRTSNLGDLTVDLEDRTVDL